MRRLARRIGRILDGLADLDLLVPAVLTLGLVPLWQSHRLPLTAKWLLSMLDALAIAAFIAYLVIT